jgi:hypothetical protein
MNCLHMFNNVSFEFGQMKAVLTFVVVFFRAIAIIEIVFSFVEVVICRRRRMDIVVVVIGVGGGVRGGDECGCCRRGRVSVGGVCGRGWKDKVV